MLILTRSIGEALKIGDDVEVTGLGVHNPVRLSPATGLRESNVTGLEWSQVDLPRRVAWVHEGQTKARNPIRVPLNNEAVVVLRQQVGKHPSRVSTCRGQTSGPG